MYNTRKSEELLICRTCSRKDTAEIFVPIDSLDSGTGQKLSQCIPELDLNLISNAVVCSGCVETVNFIWNFKNECLKTEMQILKDQMQLQHTPCSVELPQVLHFDETQCTHFNMQLEHEVLDIKEESSEDENATEVDTRQEAFNEDDNCVSREYSRKAQSSELKLRRKTCYIQKPDDVAIYYSCYTCSCKITNKTKLRSHLKKHASMKVFTKSRGKVLLKFYKCFICNYVTKFKCLYDIHNRSHLVKLKSKRFKNSRDVRSSICKAKELDNNYLAKRQIGNKTNIKLQSSNSPENLKSMKSFKCGARQVNSKAKLYKCFICESQFTRKSTLKTHLLIHTNEKPFKCSVCEYQCRHKNSLESHLLIHTNEKLFKCSVCEHQFTRKDHLKNHLWIHTNEKPFKCSVCEHRFKLRAHLKSHFLVHTNDNLFKCSVCKYQCRYKSNLKSHLLIHTNEKPFKCSVCEHQFTRSDHLKSHLLIHTNEKPFKCSVCEYQCKDKRNLKRHLSIHTNE